MEQETTATVVQLGQLLPNHWIPDARGPVWARVYHAAGAYREEISGGRIVWDLNDMRVVFVAGRISITVAPLFIQARPSGFNKYQGRVLQSIQEDGVYCIVLIRPSGDVFFGSDAEEALSSAGGLVGALGGGRSLVYELVNDSSLDPSSGQVAVTLHTRRVRSLIPVDTSDSGYRRAKAVTDAIATLPPREGRRLLLSLRWFESGLLDEGADAFMKFWTAFEALTAKEDKISFLSQCLGRAYNLAPKEAKEKFGIGRLFGLRKRILHEGSLDLPTFKLLEYLEPLYADLLTCTLGLPFERRAEAVLSMPDYDLKALLS